MKNSKLFLFHVILFSFLPSTDGSTRKNILERYYKLGDECGGREKGILFWSVKENIDLRKNIDFVEIAIFDNEESFVNFKNHPKHKELVEILKDSANWYVGDIKEAFPYLE